MGGQGSKHPGQQKKRKKYKGHLIQTLSDHEGGVNCMALSDDGSVLATGIVILLLLDFAKCEVICCMSLIIRWPCDPGSSPTYNQCIFSFCKKVSPLNNRTPTLTSAPYASIN